MPELTCPFFHSAIQPRIPFYIAKCDPAKKIIIAMIARLISVGLLLEHALLLPIRCVV
jgi:hypothetical protein